MRYVLGVDGGNFKTVAAVADERGVIHGVGRAGNSNHQGRGMKEAMDEIRRAGDAAMAEAGVQASAMAAAFYALAGADLPEDFATLSPAVAQLHLADVTELDNDSIVALRSGSDCPDAVVVAWGSGTNGAGRNSAGARVRLPALGWISGDWGGGGDLGREAVWLVARAHDGRGQSTLLTDLVLDTLGVDTVDEMIRTLYLRQTSSAQVIQLAPLIFRAAAAGDVVARAVVARASTEVVTVAHSLLQRLDLLETPADVVLAGGVFRAQGCVFRDAIQSELHAIAPRARLVTPDVEPVVGAVFHALDCLRIPVDAGLRTRARRSYEHLVHKVNPEVTV